jgi:hypothetical protein
MSNDSFVRISTLAPSLFGWGSVWGAGNGVIYYWGDTHPHPHPRCCCQTLTADVTANIIFLPSRP